MNPRHRLGGRRRIAHIRSAGAPARVDGFRARMLLREQGGTRIAIAVVGTRSAVQRNRARRRVRAALAIAPLDAPVDVVLAVPPEAAWIRFPDLQRAVGDVLQRAVTSVRPS